MGVTDSRLTALEGTRRKTSLELSMQNEVCRVAPSLFLFIFRAETFIIKSLTSLLDQGRACASLKHYTYDILVPLSA